MKHLSFLLVFLIGPMALLAQPAMNVHLFRHLHTMSDSTERIPVLVMGDIDQLSKKWDEYEAHHKYTYGNIAAITLPAYQVRSMAKNEAVQYMEYPQGQGHLLDDETARQTGADSVWYGGGQLPAGYTGKNVVIGFLDTGIDFNHPDFKHNDSTTRVAYLWDQTLSNGPNTPTQYGYGQAYDSTDINAGNCPHKDQNSHGTKVAGIAAGNGHTDSLMRGTAPDATLVVVEVKFDNNFLSNVADGIDYILQRAQDLGRPAVVNASLGSYFGAHDGLDLTTQLIENMLQATPGQAMVCASGNAGTTPFHLGYDLSADTQFTWFTYFNQLGFAYFQWYADTARFSQGQFSIGVHRPGSYQLADATEMLSIEEDFTFINDNAFRAFNLYNDSSQRLAQLEVYIGRFAGRYTVDIVVAPDSTNYLFAFRTTGAGRIDAWSHTDLTGTSNFVRNNLPDTSTYPPIRYYRKPDNAITTVSQWACSPKVVTVGSFTGRAQWPNYRGDTTFRNVTKGALDPTSSGGYTRIGIVKPDITAGGKEILTPSTLAQLASWKNSLPTYVSPSGYHVRFAGTSAASPIVAGIVALYLDRYPEATPEEVVTVLQQTAMRDSITGFQLPDGRWGFGRINAFGMVDVEKGCRDTAALNYNPNAIWDGDTCIYQPVGHNIAKQTTGRMHIYPNPAQQHIHVSWPDAWMSTTLLLQDALGREVRQTGLTAAPPQSIDIGYLPKGMYFVSLYREGTRLGTIKLMVP